MGIMRCIGFMTLLVMLAGQGFAKTEHKQLVSLTILSDPSMSAPLNLIVRNYIREHPVSITTVFSPTRQQIGDIEAGADANVVISARTSWVDMLQQKGLIDVFSRKNIARNRLVIAAPYSHIQPVTLTEGATVDAFTDMPEDFMLAIGDVEYTAEGGYAMQALQYYKLHRTLEPYYSFIRNMQQLISVIHRYDAMGIVFRTDALLHPTIKEVAAFSPYAHRPIMYQGAVVAGENMEEAREFLHYLGSDKAKAILEKFGFDPVI